MSTLVETLVETIAKDLLEVQNLEDPKTLRKESSILLKRIESAQKLVSNNEALKKKLEDIKKRL